MLYTIPFFWFQSLDKSCFRAALFSELWEHFGFTKKLQFAFLKGLHCGRSHFSTCDPFSLCTRVTKRHLRTRHFLQNFLFKFSSATRNKHAARAYYKTLFNIHSRCERANKYYTLAVQVGQCGSNSRLYTDNDTSSSCVCLLQPPRCFTVSLSHFETKMLRHKSFK